MIYLINGPDYDEVIKKVKEIAAQNSDSEVLKYNGLDNSLDYRSLGYELLNIPLVSRKLYLLENPSFLISKATASETNDINEFISSAITGEETIAIYNFYQNFDKRLKHYKDPAAHAQCIECKELRYYDYNEKAMIIIENAKLKISKENAEYLIQRLPRDIYNLRNEVEKLKLVDGPISKQIINDLTDANVNDSIFDLLDNLTANDIKSSLKNVDDYLKLSIHPSVIIQSLSSNLRFYLYIKNLYYKGNNEQQIINISKANPYRIKNILKAIDRYPDFDYLYCLNLLSDMDINVKDEYEYDFYEGFKLLMIKMNDSREETYE
ncbi:MAG: hypothetical protein IKE33_02215 [Erysipelotrichaceae bacterium]|nr:hypothetical protein [Erysipelotrichaceae bacterium]